jgi:UDP-GlcNAc:undecaprenyl-phosphate/decaprenyl-phosphate GlcNAc-1-phosphate transferase
MNRLGGGLVGVAAFVVSGILTPLFREYSVRRNRLDVPNELSAHRVPTPRSGGNAIVLGGAAAAGLAMAGGLLDREALVWAGGLATLIGLAIADERADLARGMRFFVQLGVAAATVLVSWRWIHAGAAALADHPAAQWTVALVAIVWITWMINAYNFVDGVNGMAASGAVIIGATLAVLFASRGDTTGQAIALALAGAAAGFLPWNLPSGSIFMGDVGSTTFGFLFALLVLRAGLEGMLVPALLPLLPFLLDTTWTVLIRAMKREHFFSTRHRSHFYQRLDVLGWPHWRISALWAALALGCALFAVAYESLSVGARVATLAAVLAVHALVAVAITTMERRSPPVKELPT